MREEKILTDSQTLEQILVHLERMDRRDRLRTVGGFVRTIISLVPMVIFLASMWYVYKHTDELITKVSQEAAKQAAAYTQEQSAGIIDQLRNAMPTR
jgi:hypothetical protein